MEEATQVHNVSFHFGKVQMYVKFIYGYRSYYNDYWGRGKDDWNRTLKGLLICWQYSFLKKIWVGYMLWSFKKFTNMHFLIVQFSVFMLDFLKEWSHKGLRGKKSLSIWIHPHSQYLKYWNQYFKISRIRPFLSISSDNSLSSIISLLDHC